MSMVIRSWRFGGDGAPGSDPYFSYTVLLLGYNGANGSTTVPDESYAAHGNGDIGGLNNDAHLVTAIKKFGTASAQFDGNNDAIRWSDHADWSFGSGDFTFETWAYFEAAAIETNRCLASHWNASADEREWAFNYRGDKATNALEFEVSSAGTAINLTVSGVWTPTASTWHHIAIDRSGNVFRIYVDGVMKGTATNSITMHDSTADLQIGYATSVSFLGNLDETRITKGIARYASDGGYSVPTSEFPRS